MNKFLYFIDSLKEEPLLIQIVWLLSFVLFVIIIISIIYLKFLRTHLRLNDKIAEKYKNEYEANLITYLYSENEEGLISSEQQSIIKQLKNGAINKFKREIIISTLLKLLNEISGEMADSIQNLYYQTALNNYAVAKLKSGNWYFITEGIRELKLFRVKDAHKDVEKHVNHSKSEVRKEVQLYLVNLFSFKGLNFLNDLKTPLSEWDQIQLLEELQKFDDQEIPDITLWLKSENDYVVIFALKLAKIYNQFGMKEILLELLNHESERVRLELIPVLNHLYIVEAKEVLKSNFSERSREEQIEFLKLLENLGDENDEHFILQHIYNNDFEIRLSALKILKNINLSKFENLELTKPEAEFVEMVKFIKNN
ncbi:hypothetical protein [uncultured Lutibacter sp.]|uniref:HEAT repeat domain-containing protein n=1 Tax=uncultured Lutibacter sp. TaxID=437739 RepID=UPI00260D9EA2|nr:hypothetical protein [uncultured Lutibacter sp.]